MNYDDEPPLHKDPITITIWVLLALIIGFFVWTYTKTVSPNLNYEIREESVLRQIIPHYIPKFQYSVMACISGYSSVETCPNRDCITASGKEADEYLIACPYHIPLGSVVKIKGIGRFTCADRTAYWIQEKYGDTFDLWFGDDYEGAKEFGRKYLEVEVYN